MKHKSTALLILDMVNCFDLEGGVRLGAAAKRIAPRVLALRNRFDRCAAPTIYVNDNFAHWQGQFSDLIATCRDRGGASRAVVELLSPRPHDYHILKPKHSAFLATPLPILLAKLGVESLVICGVATDSCVLASAQDANMREYRLWVPEDCVAAISAARHQNALRIASTSLNAKIQLSTSLSGIFPQ
jgi:nicotinamidase-related amidase